MIGKNKVITILGVILCSFLFYACSGASVSGGNVEKEETQVLESEKETEKLISDSGSSQAKLIEDIGTIQAFTGDAVSEEDINSIVMAGVNAPSAMNGQPWHFTVVTAHDVLEEIASDMSMGMPKGLMKPEGDNKAHGNSKDRPLPMDESKKEDGEPSDDKTEGKPAPPNGKMPEGDKPFKGDFPGGIDFSEKEAQKDDKPKEGDMTDMPLPPSGAKPPEMNGPKAGISDAPLVIVISCRQGSELDAGLATQNMSVEAQLLGYGTKIVSSPKLALNGEKQEEYRKKLGIPQDMSAVSMLLIGKTDTESYDAVSGATPRSPADEIVTYVK